MVKIKMPLPPSSLPPAESESNWRVESEHGKIVLVNAETNTQIDLPPIFPDSSKNNSQIHKAVVSFPPSGLIGTNCCVVAIVGKSKQLACFTADSQSWILLQESDEGEVAETSSNFDDLLSHEGHVYAVDEYGRVVMCVIDYFSCSIQKFREVTRRWFFWGDRVYLTVIKGVTYDSLFLIVRYWKRDDKRGETTTYRFRACALDYHHGKNGYEVNGLSNWTVLLGRTKTVSFGPYQGGNGGFRPNCIYFLDTKGECHIPRVFSMDDKTIEELQDSKEAAFFLAATTTN